MRPHNRIAGRVERVSWVRFVESPNRSSRSDETAGPPLGYFGSPALRRAGEWRTAEYEEGAIMLIRRLKTGDEDVTRAFFERIPEADQRFFKEDVLDSGIWLRLTGDSRARRLLAIDDEGQVRGYAAVVPGVGWSAHVAELHVIVDPEQRRQGLGSQLAWKALELTRELDLKKLMVEVVAEQAGAVAMFQGLGFYREAVLPRHVRDRDGKEHDLLLLANTGLLALHLHGAP
jgi:ribosomal protein S18 acetylase RimI-like enzyme